MRLKDTGLTPQELKDLVKTYMIETYERMDFIAESGEGIWLYDEQGRPYLDFNAGIAVNALGNCNPKVVAAAEEQLHTLIHTFNYPYTIPQAVLAKEICEATGMDKLIYQNSGSEANEAMIKMARKYGIEHYGPEKYEIITAKQSFHGRTLLAMTATGQPNSAIHKNFGQLASGFRYAEYNNLQAFQDAVTENTIAIMVEPVQGEGGVYPATEEFLQGLRTLCNEKGLLLLLDEVQAGWGRCGGFMCYQTYGVQPDAVSMAKAMGGGMPIAAVAATKELASAFTPGSHGSTYAGHPVACAASLAELREIQALDAPKNAKLVGDYLAKRLETLPHVQEIRHRGLLIGIQLDDRVDAVEVKHKCVENYMVVSALGGNVIRLVPPLIIRGVDADLAVERLRNSILEAATVCKG